MLTTQTKKVESKKSGLISSKCDIADNYFSRAKGLLGRKTFTLGEGLLITRCSSIHTWFMKFKIDVVFLTREAEIEGISWYHVSSIHSELYPWKFFPVSDWRSSDTLELPDGTIKRCQIEVGDVICIA